MDINLLLQTFQDLLFNRKTGIPSVITSLLKDVVRLFGWRWAVLHFIPLKENNILKESLFCSDSRLSVLFHLRKDRFRKTALYKMQAGRKLQSGEIRINKSYPEYIKKYRFYIFRFPSTQFILAFEFCAESKFTDHKLLETLAQYLRNGIEMRENEVFHQNKMNDLLNLIEISKMLNSTINLDSLLNQLFVEVKKIMNVEGCSLMLVDKDTGELKVKTVKGKGSQRIKEAVIPAGKGIAGWIAAAKTPVIVNDVQKDKRFYPEMDKKTGVKTRTIIGAPLISKDNVIGIIEGINKVKNQKFTEPDKELFIALASQAAVAIQNAEYYNELRTLFLSTVKSLSAAIDAKDKYTIGHSERVTQYSLLLAKALRLDPDFIRIVELSGLLHDIGKIGIDDKILTKPARLTPEEYEVIKKHPIIGEEIIKPIRELNEILPGIRNHHERWDGKGYPDGLSGSNIPLLGRIITLADCYDAMTSDRPYRVTMNRADAETEVRQCSGTQFDPDLARVFLKVIKKNNW
ncbi:MAG: HD domain-containing protein [bacterium]|nr:HD domain-containing protein [bacterium]